MSGSTTYLFYAIDQPLSHTARAEIQKLSRRANPTARRADFWYNVDGYDLPVPYESLLAPYYDVMVRQEYEFWTLAMALPYETTLYQSLKQFECEDGEGCGVRVEAMDSKYVPHTKRRVSKPTRVLAEISTFIDYGVRKRTQESIEGLRGWDWEEDSDEEEETADDWTGEYGTDDSVEETLARLTNMLRAAALRNDFRGFVIAWQKFHSPGSKRQVPIPSRNAKLPAYLKGFKRMLRSGDER